MEWLLVELVELTLVAVIRPRPRGVETAEVQLLLAVAESDPREAAVLRVLVVDGVLSWVGSFYSLEGLVTFGQGLLGEGASLHAELQLVTRELLADLVLPHPGDQVLHHAVELHSGNVDPAVGLVGDSEGLGLLGVEHLLVLAVLFGTRDVPPLLDHEVLTVLVAEAEGGGPFGESAREVDVLGLGVVGLPVLVLEAVCPGDADHLGGVVEARGTPVLADPVVLYLVHVLSRP